MIPIPLLITFGILSRSSANVGQVSSAMIKRLESSRERFFNESSKQPESGYSFGSEGSSHEIVFPVGRSDILYYVSFVVGEPDEKGNWKASVSVTKWQSIGRSYRKVWCVPFNSSKSEKP